MHPMTVYHVPMNPVLRGLLFLILLLGIVVTTGAVLQRHEKMALFLEARDRIDFLVRVS